MAKLFWKPEKGMYINPDSGLQELSCASCFKEKNPDDFRNLCATTNGRMPIININDMTLENPKVGKLNCLNNPSRRDAD